MTLFDGGIVVATCCVLPFAARRGLAEVGESWTVGARGVAGLALGGLAVAYLAVRGIQGGAILVACLAVSVLTDIRSGVVLDLVVGVGLASLAASAGFDGTLVAYACGTAVLCVVMGGIFALARGGIGAGDVKLASVLGGALGTTSGLTALAFAFVVGGVVAVMALWTGRARRGTAIPFAPFVAIGAVLALVLQVTGVSFP